MKTYFKYIALTLLLALGLVSCEDNENWRIIPYEPEPEAPVDGPEQLYVVRKLSPVLEDWFIRKWTSGFIRRHTLLSALLQCNSSSCCYSGMLRHIH